MQIAVIDVGTNTINLLVASLATEGLNLLHASKIGAKLGKGTINSNVLSPEAIQRGLGAIKDHVETIKNYKVEKTLVFATSAVRNATNGNIFANEVKKLFGLEMNIISGDEEARLIYEGVKPLFPYKSKKYLILDIGGGSCEFIIADNKKMLWAQSFELGMARLLDKFNPKEPISQGELQKINQYFENQLTDFSQAVAKYKPQVLIGASGSFDTIVNMQSAYFETDKITISKVLKQVPAPVFKFLYDKIIPSTISERLQMPGMDPVRVEFMVLAMLFIQHVIGILKPSAVFQSAYAIKEGIIFNYLQKNN